MIYAVEIVYTELPEGQDSMPSEVIPGRYSTVALAEDAANMKVADLRRSGRRAFYHILDAENQPVDPNGKRIA